MCLAFRLHMLDVRLRAPASLFLHTSFICMLLIYTPALHGGGDSLCGSKAFHNPALRHVLYASC